MMAARTCTLVVITLLVRSSVASGERGSRPPGLRLGPPCVYGPPLANHYIMTCASDACAGHSDLPTTETACNTDTKCTGVTLEAKPGSPPLYSCRAGSVYVSPSGINQTAWVITNAAACGHSSPHPMPPPPPPSPPTPPPPPPPPPMLKRTPFPLPATIVASGLPVQLAHDVQVSITSPAGDCANSTTTCGAIAQRYTKLLQVKTSANFATSPPDCDLSLTISVVRVVVSNSSDYLGPGIDESYTLRVNGTAVAISAHSIYGARHGLESFAAMVGDAAEESSVVKGVLARNGCGRAGWIEARNITITDAPAFGYRGLMLDTGRHYVSVPKIKHLLRGLAMLKINVLHWHIADTESFPVKSDLYPQLANAAFAPAAVYTMDDLRDLVLFAKVRGIRVVPEFDVPGHGSWRAMPQLNLSVCPNVLNVTSDDVYLFLRGFLAEMTDVFEDAYLFLGGDEVSFHCFDNEPSIVAWMRDHCSDLGCCANASACSLQMLDYFFKRFSSDVQPALPQHRTLGLWLADPGNIARGWNPPSINAVPLSSVFNVYQSMQTAKISLAANRSTVVSVAGSQWYLDYKPDFATVWKVRPCDELSCDDHKGWRDHLLGGEVCMWGTSVDGNPMMIDVDAFSGGAAAVAERFVSLTFLAVTFVLGSGFLV